MRSITYNDQRNNKSHFEKTGSFSAWNQCFTSDAVMLMSYYCPDIHGDDDDFLAQYLFDIEDSLNKDGLGAEIREKMHLGPATKSSYFFAVQAAGITNYLNNYGISGRAVVQELFSIEDVPFLVVERPVIIGTHNLGGLPDGHMILLVDFDSDTNCFKANDSFGDANTGYNNKNGEGVMYNFELLKKRIEVKDHPGECNILYFEKE